MELTESSVWKADTIDNNGSHYILFSDAMKEYLGYDPKKHKLIIKADKGKHGRFFGIGIVPRDKD